MSSADWADIEPIAQDDGPNPLVVIKYDPNYTTLMNIFRGVLRVGEKSRRVLELTTLLLDINAANYTVWQYRRDCLRVLNASSDYSDEFDYMDQFAEENPKNYQIWFHRRAIVDISGDPSRELQFCAEVFEIDAKNYHAWAHRQWVLTTYGQWDGELALIEYLLRKDIRNNSAWNQRWFYIHNGPDKINLDILVREVEFVFNAIFVVSLNESAWNYLRGLYKTHPEIRDEIVVRLKVFLTSDNENLFAVALLGDIMEEKATSVGLKIAQSAFTTLAELDKIRTKYWTQRVKRISAKLDAA